MDDRGMFCILFICIALVVITLITQCNINSIVAMKVNPQQVSEVKR